MRHRIAATAAALAIVVGSGAAAVALIGTGTAGATTPTYTVKANTPPVVVAPGTIHEISSVSVEQQAAMVPVGTWVCTELTPTTNAFDRLQTPTVSVTKGNGTVDTVKFETPTGSRAKWVVYKVKTASTDATSTFTLSGLYVIASSTPGPVKAKVYLAAATTCSVPVQIGTATAYTVGPTAPTRIYGNTMDATAAKELETVFPATVGTTTTCPGVAGDRPVVLATDTTYPDALSSQYLAGYLETGTLLTPASTLSSPTLTALRTEGITHVYVVGGPLVVSTTVLNQLKTSDAYKCGGQTVTASAGTIKVTRIYGQTEYDTAAAIAEHPPASYVGTASFPGAYSGVNTAGGDGKFNDTSGKASLTPSTVTPMKTAIVATGEGFADAMSASTLAYRTHLPILLTTPTSLSTQAKQAIVTLGIKQVILMGGPLAISNTVVTALQNLNVSVLRIAGVDYTDTAVQLADFEYTVGTGDAWTPPTGDVTVARGDFYSDGLAGAVVNGNTKSLFYGQPLLLTLNPTTLGTYLPTFLKKAGTPGIDDRTTAKISNLTILGGPLAISTASVSKMESDLSS